MSAASTARRRRGADELDVVAFERGSITSYAACGLPYYIGDEVESAESLIARSPEQHRANGIDVRLRHEVLGIDPGAGRIRVRDLDAGREHDEPYDRLLIATGAAPLRPQLPGIDLAGVFGLHTIPDALALRARLDGAESPARLRAVVVGGGYIGIEMVEALLARGCTVTLIHRGEQPMPTLDADMGERVAAALRALGVELRSDTDATGFVAGPDGRVAAVATESSEVPADVVVLGLGIRPRSELARDAGIAIGAGSGGITTDSSMATSAEGIWAAGDCVETHHRITGRPVFVALGTHANKQGRVAGINLSGGSARFPGVVGTAITKVASTEIARTGLDEREAATAGFAAVAATIEGSTRAGYYPAAAPIAIKVVAERGTGQLLGAQIVGGPGSGKRIDAVAVALWNDMTVDDFAQLDLAYAPPFSPVWDPLLIAARRVADLV
jgi:NADPH-dependent 2,4-dienoyl-CoA reductase/sulfur reductase-like enzyme